MPNTQALLNYLGDSPTPYHATANIRLRLEAAGFVLLDEAETWNLKQGGKYIVTRNDSSIIAFQLNQNTNTGFRMMGAHTDSPCIRVKPNPELEAKGYAQLSIETYGGLLIGPWFDRDLSLAGRVSYVNKDGQLAHQLVDFKKAIAFIPSLAIHLNREANDGHKVNKQNELAPLLFQHFDDESGFDFRALLMEQLEGHDCCEILDFDLSFYDVQKPALVGLNEQFIASARIDNLLSCHVGLDVLLGESQQNVLLTANDHEEVGSQSAHGADGSFLEQVLRRIAGADEALAIMLNRSMLVSIDNAHALHPNYQDKHDPKHQPLLNHGPVIKVNANQRYATSSETAARFRMFCKAAEVPVQVIAMRADMGCGSTIGPITASRLGVRTLDIGMPQLGMHSIRELCGIKDATYTHKALAQFAACERLF